MTKITLIEYRCLKSPENNQLKGFSKGKLYKGRSFNDLFEITTEWASHQPTFLIDRREFEKYFEVVGEKQRQEA